MKSIVTYDGDLAEAFPPMSVTICLEDEIDISRGDMLAPPGNLPHADRRLEARAVVTAIRHRVNINTLAEEAAGELRLNEIGVVAVEAFRPLLFDAYRRNRATGAFILIDPITNETAGAGMILGRGERPAAGHRVSAEEREARAGHRAVTIWLKGDEEQAYALERKLFDRGCLVNVVGDAREARVSNEAGLISICVARGEVEEARAVVGAERLVEWESAEIPEFLVGQVFTGGAGI